MIMHWCGMSEVKNPNMMLNNINTDMTFNANMYVLTFLDVILDLF